MLFSLILQMIAILLLKCVVYKISTAIDQINIRYGVYYSNDSILANCCKNLFESYNKKSITGIKNLILEYINIVDSFIPGHHQNM